MNKSGKLIAVASILCLSLAACGQKKAENQGGGKAAVKVNGQVISVAEIDAKMAGLNTDSKHGVSESMFQKLIDMELLRQEAEHSKLDTDEKVQARIAIAKRMVLAMAYMEKQLEGVAKPTEQEVTEFYNQNPARYSERKLYGFQEFSIQPPAGKSEEIQAQVAKIKDFKGYDQWLTDNKIPHGSNPVTMSSDRLPDDVLAKLKDVHVGGAAVVGNKDQLNVIYVLSEQLQPIPLVQVKTTISNMLEEKRKSDVLSNMVKQARDKAKIEYVSPYTATGFTPPVDNQ
jgi:EpsD family peptidyl-prolyl cis-trans isomerase